MTHDSETVSAEITRLVDQLRAARAARPPSLLQRMMDDPALYRQMRDEARQRAQSRFPHLFDRDYAAKLWLRIGGGDVPVLDSGEDTEPVKRTRKRRPTLAGVARQAARAGIDVAGYEIRPDGSIKIITGQPDGTTSTDGEPTTPDRSEWN